MLAKKRKISKKEIRQDKLITFYYKSIEFYQKFKRNINIALGVAAIAIVLIVLYYSNKAKNNESASFEVSQIVKLMEAGNFQEAIDGRPNTKLKGLKKIVDDYGSTNNGQLAKIYLGQCYYNLKKYDDALKAFESFGGKGEYPQSVALAGEAACYEAKEQWEKAAGLYYKAANVSEKNFLNAQYLLFAGIDYLEVDKKEDAKEMFDIIKRDYPQSEQARSGVARYYVQVE